ncbi:hypothetical protein JOF56_000373 [Kibdelosporangium banguiense]|uniref:DUF4429 domain-containing protein n=1 Tax=Kibdelosporangium banguiense TaxID=1365924 RepID=A0ABS4T807_9PSEU|nr:DUF4429 domain-containing protein [Kibdelosporangium banguiense]MBP2319988.1 hypothetical protein [Kibdelosporangium banguiense]
MDEVLGRDGTWTFDLAAVRLIPGHGRGVHKLRQAIGEVTVPLEAIAGMSFEPGRKGGRLRLRLREGADPLTQATASKLGDNVDPYTLAITAEQTATSQYFAESVRTTLLVQQVPSTATDHYLLPAPGVPISATAGDGTAHFDGENVRLEWNWMAKESKTAVGPTQIALGDIATVQWQPQSGFSHGYLRFQPKNPGNTPAPEVDRNCLAWGVQREGGTTVLLASAVVARMPHPFATPVEPKQPSPQQDAGDPDAMLRRLRELGELHRSGVLTDEEFTAAKQALLRL